MSFVKRTMISGYKTTEACPWPNVCTERMNWIETNYKSVFLAGHWKISTAKAKAKAVGIVADVKMLHLIRDYSGKGRNSTKAVFNLNENL